MRLVQDQTSTIPVGTLLVNLYDPAKKQLIWRGDATKTLDLKTDPDKNYRNLQKAMAKLFKTILLTEKSSALNCLLRFRFGIANHAVASYFTISKMPAAPIPPPTHMVTMP